MPELLLTVPDVVCFDDLDAFGRETTSDLETLWQDVYHMLIEILGSNIDDVGRGVGVRQLLSGSTETLATVGGRIDQGLEQDDRINASSTTISQDSTGKYRISIQIDVNGTVIGLDYEYSSSGALVFLGAR